MTTKRERVLAAITSGAEYRFIGPVLRLQHKAKWRGYYNARGVSICTHDGETAVVPLALLNAAIRRGIATKRA